MSLNRQLDKDDVMDLHSEVLLCCIVKFAEKKWNELEKNHSK